jgi:hypothetical protein
MKSLCAEKPKEASILECLVPTVKCNIGGLGLFDRMATLWYSVGLITLHGPIMARVNMEGLDNQEHTTIQIFLNDGVFLIQTTENA